MVSLLLLKGPPFQNLFIFTAAGVKCGVATLKRLPMLHHGAYYIFWSFGITELMLVCLEYTILLNSTLGGVRDAVLFSNTHEQTQ